VTGVQTCALPIYNLKELGFSLIRLKTGTPPRIKTSSIDFKKCKEENGSDEKNCFSHYNPKYLDIKKQTPCFLTYTNKKTHEIILKNIKLSAMYGGTIHGVGPRYCPSIEDKIVRFGDKERHQIFIEPCAKKLDFMYIQGMSTSLPAHVQDLFIRSIEGLEKAEFVRYGYAIEYDAIDPTQLYPSLETKKIKGLFTAGQINGTSGYEEAAGQGFIAGLNIGLKLKNKKPLILKRDESYIGVMIDDIVTKGVTDPYRLLTSRAEHRLYLRNDNADDRLIKYGYTAGLINENQYNRYLNQNKSIKKIMDVLKNTKLNEKLLKKYGNSAHNLLTLLKRPEIKLNELLDKKTLSILSLNSIAKLEINVKYAGYIKKQNSFIKKTEKYESIDISNIKDFKIIKSLSLEARDKLNKIKPLNLGQAQRIQGINLSDIVAIKYYLENKNNR
jgi:tRNA uridine 5-carboxymethylaminomethyl modification enzyme